MDNAEQKVQIDFNILHQIYIKFGCEIDEPSNFGDGKEQSQHLNRSEETQFFNTTIICEEELMKNLNDLLFQDLYKEILTILNTSYEEFKKTINF